MNLNDAIIRTRKQFERGLELVRNVFESDRPLPEQVFREHYGNFLFENFYWAMSSEFWPVLQKLANQSNDHVILMGVLEPEPLDYYYSNFGFFNWCNLEIDLSADDYADILETAPESSPADALLYYSDVVVWVPYSMKWGVWGERDHEVAILAYHEDETHLSQADFLDSWATSVDEAIADLLPVQFMKKEIVAEFLETFRQNYTGRNISNAP